jgi:hypothetical protein
MGKVSKMVNALKSPAVISGIGTLILTIAIFFAQGGFQNMNLWYIVGFVVGAGLIIYGLVKEVSKEKLQDVAVQSLGNVVTKESLTKTLKGVKRTGKLENISPLETDWVIAKTLEMTWAHGHDDFFQLLAEIADDIPLSELMARPCSRCGIPRNKKGRSLDELWK